MIENKKKNIYNAIQNLYNMDFNSWQEVLGMLYNLVADIDQKFEVFESKFESTLGKEITLSIKEMIADGTIGELINSDLLNSLVNDVNTFKKDITLKVNNFTKDFNNQVYNVENNKANKVDLQVLEKRFDNIAFLPEDSTQGSAELIDGRVSADGKVYSSIGSAIREQIKGTAELVKAHNEITNKAIGVNNACSGIVTLHSIIENLFDTSLVKTKEKNTQGTWTSNIYTRDGLTFIVDETANIITVNGTASANTGIEICDKRGEFPITAPFGYSGCPTGGSNTKYSLRAYVKRDNGNIYLGEDVGNGYICNGNITTFHRLLISIKQGTICNNLQFKLMVNSGLLIQPYVPKNYDINIYGGNIFDYTLLKHYVNINPSNGENSEWRNYIGTKAYIPFWENIDFSVFIKKGGSTTQNSNLTIAYYDENKSFISGGKYNSIHQHSPKGCKYIRFSYYSGDFTIIENLTIAFGHLTDFNLYPYKKPSKLKAENGAQFINDNESFNLITDDGKIKFGIKYPTKKFVDLINANIKDIKDLREDIEQVKNKTGHDSIPSTYISKEKELLWGKMHLQDLTIVGEELWGICASNDSHSDYANIHRWDIDTMREKPNFKHNLGHGASLDYNAETNCLMVGNGTTPTNILPRMDIIHNANNLCGEIEHQITLGGDGVVSIDFSKIGGSGLCCCWGESKAIAYLFVMTNDHKRHIHKVKLGMGANNYADGTEQPERRFGNFISGKTANEYNGTAYLLSSHTGIDTWTFQGCCYHDGYLHLATGGHIARVLKIQCLTNGTYDIVSSYEIEDYYADQNRMNFEPEGACIYRGIYLVTYVGNMNIEAEDKICMLPMYNKQAGKGTIGTKVNLPFKCNMKPLIQITPTSNTTDLYINQLDNTSFTVLSSSDGNGTFNWECPIS